MKILGAENFVNRTFISAVKKELSKLLLPVYAGLFKDMNEERLIAS
jgi:hypothetical protein